MILGLDTEATGLDTYHGAMPFLVTFCDEENENTFYEWDVDPFTRIPEIPAEDVAEIQALIDAADLIYMQNAKFDVQLLKKIGIKNWDWSKVRDTLYGGHLLASNQPHDLTSMALIYLGINIKPFEDAVIEACKAARTMAGRRDFIERHGEWLLAAEGVEGMPSAGEKNHKYDMWLPRAIALAEGYDENHPWWNVTNQYANPDSSVVLPLGIEMERRIEQLGLTPIYEECLKRLAVLSSMESFGVTGSVERLEEQRLEYIAESERLGSVCVNIAEEMGFQLSLPKSGNNNSLRSFIFDVLKLPVVKESKKTKAPGLDKTVLEHYQSILPKGSKSLTFVSALRGKRSRDTALLYIEGYKRYWKLEGDYFRLHPSLNATGTDTLRMSSQNPNEQNISAKEGFNLRYAFGPTPGKLWASFDYSNIELRIPAYIANEKEMIALFEHPDDPPYFGGLHALMFHVVYPKEFDACAKHNWNLKKYEPTKYKQVKAGDFSVQYGSVEQSGTADRAYGKPGAFLQVKSRFGQIHGPGGLNEQCIAFANQHGYIETVPDKEICPERGYPLLCTRSKWGKVLPTVPLNFKTQGTACWVMMRAMIKVFAYLNAAKLISKGWRIIMNIHDELVIEFPENSNYAPILLRIKAIMESLGECIGVPLKVGLEIHRISWDKGEPLASIER